MDNPKKPATGHTRPRQTKQSIAQYVLDATMRKQTHIQKLYSKNC